MHCGCTTPTISDTFIRPESTETFDVEYRAGPSAGDDTQTVLVEFNEEWAPLFRLTVSAAVRPPLTVDPSSQIFLGRVGRGVPVHATVDVENYSESDWEGVQATCDWSWALLEVRKVERESGGSKSARQHWRTIIRGIPANDQHGETVGYLNIRAIGAPKLHATVPMHVEVVEPVNAIPSSVFLGRLSPGVTATRKVTIHFAKGALPRSVTDVKLMPDAPERVTLNWERISGQFWELSVTVRAPKEGGTFSGQIVLGFEDGKLNNVTIPYSGLVNSAALAL